MSESTILTFLTILTRHTGKMGPGTWDSVIRTLKPGTLYLGPGTRDPTCGTPGNKVRNTIFGIYNNIIYIYIYIYVEVEEI